MFLSIKEKIILFYYFLASKKNKWEYIEYFDESWKHRIKEMVKLIPEDARSILDIGCGDSWLRTFIKSDCKYYGVDYKKRDSHTIVCDLNQRQFPRGMKVDVAFCSGVLEYIEKINLEWFFQQIRESSSVLLLSYCTLELNKNLRGRISLCWKNHFYKEDLIRFIERIGFSFVHESDFSVDGNQIFKFDSKY